MLTTTCALDVIAQGDPMEMGVAQGESLRKRIQSSPGVIGQLYGFRSVQPLWMPYPLYRFLSETKARQFLERPLTHDFNKVHRRLTGISAGADVRMSMLYLVHALEPMLSDVSRCTVVPAF